MATTTATKAAGARATYKGHGTPQAFVYFGHGDKPADTGRKVASVTNEGAGFVLRDKDGQTIDNFGTASKFWAADCQTAEPEAKATKAPEGNGACRCQCGQAKGKGQFRPGHDARYLSNLRKDYEAGKLTQESAQAAAEAVSPAMGRKMARSLELAAGRLAARETATAGAA